MCGTVCMHKKKEGQTLKNTGQLNQRRLEEGPKFKRNKKTKFQG